MRKNCELISILTDQDLLSSQKRTMLREYAQQNNWFPSDEIDDYSGTTDFSNGHLLIEHGLDNTAVITFLKKTRPFQYLTYDDKLRLLSISYNNLVDWHLFPDTNGLTYIYNRIEPIKANYISIQEQKNIWQAEAFDKIIDRRPSPNLKSIENALVDTISFWKRVLASELGIKLENKNISALFNGLLCVRALEDNRREFNPNTRKLLIEQWEAPKSGKKTLKSCLISCIKSLGIEIVPTNLLDVKNLAIFGSLDRETVKYLFLDFYKNKFAPYQYDFSLISKHAISNIYEHYISMLKQEESPQYTLFPDLPNETYNREFGGVYTPQYIARFFARFLKENHTPIVFRKLKIADPSCGSGIFLRTILEMQCDPFQEIDMRLPIKNAFSRIAGIDIDENACYVTRLSLSLLHLSLTNRFPKSLNIINDDTIDFFQKTNIKNSYDAIVANPPYIKWDRLKEKQRILIKELLKNLSSGKIDMYLAHLKIGMEMVKPGGFLLYVLPHTFLISNSAEKLRKEILKTFHIRLIADLSTISIFKDVGSYVILLILQKKGPNVPKQTKTTIVRCKDRVGQALQVALEGKNVSNNIHEVYEVNEHLLNTEKWIILPPKQISLKSKIEKHPTLEKLASITVGFITGADDIFIRNIDDIPLEEKPVYAPYLSDREMVRFAVPSIYDRMVFYPFRGNTKLTETDIKEIFPKTWKYLRKHSKRLNARRSSISNPWWRPVRPRSPKIMLRRKIISPHLVLTPKFSYDSNGCYAVSHCPIIYPIDETYDNELYYYYLLAILNSSISSWQMANICDKYSRGYFMLEPKTLKKIHVPAPDNISSTVMSRIHCLAKELTNAPNVEHEAELDLIVSEIYGLTEEGHNELGALR